MIEVKEISTLRCVTEDIITAAYNSRTPGEQTIYVAPESSKAAVERLVVELAAGSSIKVNDLAPVKVRITLCVSSVVKFSSFLIISSGLLLTGYLISKEQEISIEACLKIKKVETKGGYYYGAYHRSKYKTTSYPKRNYTGAVSR